MLYTQHISRVFPSPDGKGFYALRDINIHVPQGKLTILKGRSGSGKTTLMNILSTLDGPSEGNVIFDGEDVTHYSEDKRTRLRREKIGFVFQSVALIPMMNALENVEFALRLARSKEDRTARAMECLAMVGLDKRAKHMPQELSGGEQQRVAIARAIAHKPRVLFADEPTAELDTNTGLQVMHIFKEMIRESGITIVMTTHDMDLAAAGDCIYTLKDGEICDE